MTAEAREIARVACQEHHASQRYDELAEAVALVAAAAPQVIVEIGCDAGGTLYCWRQICPAVYAITLADNGPATGGQGYPLTTHGAVVCIGDSHHAGSLAWLKNQLGRRPIDVLHIDGDHTYEGAAADYEMYSPLVRPGGLVLIHDVLNYQTDVPRFWRDVAGDAGQVIASKRPRPVGFGVLKVGGN